MGYKEVVVLLFMIAFLGLMSNGGRRSGSNPQTQPEALQTMFDRLLRKVRRLWPVLLAVPVRKQEHNRRESMFFVGQWRSHSLDGTVWDYQGVFSTYEKALAACKTDTYFIAPVRLDEEIPEGPTTWEVEYPTAEARSGRNPEE